MDGTTLSTLSLIIRDWLLSDVRSLFVAPYHGIGGALNWPTVQFNLPLLLGIEIGPA
jgi:hypothetical protein